MAFAEDFATALAEHGVVIDPAALPDEDTVKQEVSAAFDWFWTIDPALREGFDEGTGEYAICYLLADGDLAVAPHLGPVFEAFDQVSGTTVSALLEAARSAAANAGGGDV